MKKPNLIMRGLNSLKSTKTVMARCICTEQSGAVTPLFATALGLMLMTLTGGVDAIRVHMTGAQMQQALDAATLTSGANIVNYPTLQGSDLAHWQADAQAYYNANMGTSYMGSTPVQNSFTATVTGSYATGQTISLSTQSTLPLISLGFLKLGYWTISSSNQALRQNKTNLELVMALDDTGSMAQSADGSTNGPSKLSGLVSAANDLVSILLGSQQTSSTYIGLVPFASTVNVANIASAPSWIGSVAPYNPLGITAPPGAVGNWGGCIVEPRDVNNNLAPVVYNPALRPFKAYYFNTPVGGMTVYSGCSSNGSQAPTTASCAAKPAFYNATTSLLGPVPVTMPTAAYSGTIANSNFYVAPNPRGQAGNPYATKASWGNTTQFAVLSGYGNYTAYYTQNQDCNPNKATFLTSDANVLTKSIGSLSATGSTIIPLGLLWGWRMLSPTWAGATGWGVANLPQDPAKVQGLSRILVILTDGTNAVGAHATVPNDVYFNGLSGVGDATLTAPTVKRADGTTLANGRIDAAELHGNIPEDSNTSNGAGWTDDIDAYQAAVCSAIKADGVTIYAITFGNDSSSGPAQTNMQNCATDAQHYYHAPTNAALTAVFDQIAGSLTELRLIQ